MSDTESMVSPCDQSLAAMLGEIAQAPTNGVAEIVRRIEMDGKVIETRVLLSPPAVSIAHVSVANQMAQISQRGSV